MQFAFSFFLLKVLIDISGKFHTPARTLYNGFVQNRFQLFINFLLLFVYFIEWNIDSYKPQTSVNRNFSLALTHIAYRIFVTQQFFTIKFRQIYNI